VSRAAAGLAALVLLFLPIVAGPSPAQEEKVPMHTPNRLARARSPYLLQHKDNPVDWYEWGEEAFEKARREDRPIFLSVGYSSCHWCHVMERESFEDPEVARALNEGFVSIKVDREERPDVDDVYMRVTQMLTGSGGWPMSVFMTPDRRPFFAGTYFPKEPKYGQVGFLRLLAEIRKAWTEKRGALERSADEIAQAAASAGALPEEGPAVKLDGTLVRVAAAALERRYDERNGGFGGAPKFPPHHALRLFLDRRAEAGGRAVEMALATLDKMAAGGIHDQIGGGFARYATDEVWLVPHFEKMLYDNAMLARAYAAAFEATGKPRYRRVAEGIFGFVARELTDPAGGFYSALDADSEGVEGKYYVWTPAETAAVLGAEEAEAFDAFYDVTPHGNWEGGKSIPRVKGDLDAAPRFDEARAKLLLARGERVPPGLDDKVIAGWNGLMIGAYARGYAAFRDERYRAAAEKAARFLLEKMRGQGGVLLRTWRRGEAGIPAYLDDHALLADGLLDLYEATGEKRWLDAARGLADTMIAEFGDPVRGGFYSTSARHERLLFRQRDAFDDALPSGNGAAARVLARLAKAPGGERYGAEADRTIRAFAGALPRAALAMLTLIEAVAIRGGVAPGPAPAPAGAGPGGEGEDPVTLTAAIAGPIAPGGRAVAIVTLAIAQGFHLNSDEPGRDDLVPTKIAAVATDLPIRAGVPFYPLGAEKRLAFAERPVRLFEGTVEIRLPLEVAVDATPGAKGTIEIAVRYQACDAVRCLAPREKRVEIPVVIGG
jgi:hypothetical protein